MANHLFKSSYGQCDCRWCGKRSTAVAGTPCPVTDEIRYALRVFKTIHGRNWKSKLIAYWQTPMHGEHLACEFQQARNIIGPSRLLRIPTKLL